MKNNKKDLQVKKTYESNCMKCNSKYETDNFDDIVWLCCDITLTVINHKTLRSIEK